MDHKDLALYPYVSEASRYVASLDFSLDRLISSRAMESARLRGKERVLQSIGGEILKPGLLSSDDRKILVELLSYPFSRILVSCMDDPFLTRRYSLAEAVSSYKSLKGREVLFLKTFAMEFDIHSQADDSGFRMHFTDYIRLANTLKATEWKLVNRKLDHGYVKVSKDEFARLLQEGVRNRIEGSLPVSVPDNVRQACEPYLEEIRIALHERKSAFGGGSEFGSVESELFPPCIIYAISQTRAGVNLAHSMRFAMTSFLLTVGMSVDDIMNLFASSPDFDVEKARYQVEHIAGASGTSYKPPSCSTMKTYGNCYSADEICDKIKHPLGYYQRKIWFKNKDDKKQAVKQSSVNGPGSGS
ncbi:DNA primase regulatory subunit PriL [Methanolobus halotolerans]|uniref:DNA primase large subunit PriL n=1 Tax=Methanolobus halotolerans TaxID=2052935 RepID=A0A4E0R165_9EURY|nr:DNA primase regulatory subunit PriL [Methanolobus halotolerans]TGC10889.1 DNA primase regulatory subunit PriL [Methanolobus halotolerans]